MTFRFVFDRTCVSLSAYPELVRGRGWLMPGTPPIAVPELLASQLYHAIPTIVFNQHNHAGTAETVPDICNCLGIIQRMLSSS